MYDLVIRNGTIYDGNGEKPYFADLAITGKTIAKIGFIKEKGLKEIDAKGKIVTQALLIFTPLRWPDYLGSLLKTINLPRSYNCRYGKLWCRFLSLQTRKKRLVNRLNGRRRRHTGNGFT